MSEGNSSKMKSNKENFARRHRSFFVGIFILIPLISIPCFLVYTLMKTEWLQKWCKLYVSYENTFGLSKGNSVTYKGMIIGHVDKVELDAKGMIGVRFRINRQYIPLVRKDTKAQLKQKSFVVGDWEIEMKGGSQGANVVDDGDTLLSDYAFRVDQTIEQITGMVSVVGKILQEVLDGKGTVGKLITEDTLVHELNMLARNLTKISVQASKTVDNVDSVLYTFKSTGQSSTGLIDSLAALTVSLKNALTDVESITKQAKVASDDLPVIMKQVQDELYEADKMIKALERNWLVRKTVGKRPDPLLINP